MKPFLSWRDEWLLGIEALDNQHRQLADCLNRLVVECSCENEPTDRDRAEKRSAVRALLDELYQQTRAHFEFEEAMMRRCGYPGYPSHAREHVMLLAELKSTFISALREGCCDMNPEILQALKSWLVAHVALTDREFADYLLEHAEQNQETGNPA